MEKGGSVQEQIEKSRSKAATKMKNSYDSIITQASKLKHEEQGYGIESKKSVEKMLEKAKTQKNFAMDQARDALQGIKFNKNSNRFVDEKTGKFVKLTEAQKAANLLLENDGAIMDATIGKIEKRIGLEDKFNKKLGFGTKLAGGLDKAMQKAGLPSIGIADAVEKTREGFIEANLAGGKTAKNFSVMGNLAKNLGKNLMGAFTASNLIQGAFTMLIKAIIEVDKASGEFAKNNGISYQRALQIRGEMNEIAKSSEDVLVNSRALMETQGTLNEYFGQSVVMGGKLTEEMTSIAKRTKMTAETQGVFALESLKTGKGTKDILKTQTLQVMETNKQLGLQLSVKQVQDAIGKTSKSIQMNFQGSTKELTKQVMAVKKLGVNMSTAEQIASSMLDFESSIQAELEAELLLGKNINLEKARQFALQGDMGKMSKEVLKNEAIMEAFNTKNVIAQEAAAKALGLNREQLADMIMEQQKQQALEKAGFKDIKHAQTEYNKLRERGMSAEQAALEIGDKDLAAQLESVSAQEKLAATLERVQELFVSLAEPILAIVTPIADIMVPAITMVSDTLSYIVGSVTGFYDIQVNFLLVGTYHLLL